MQRERKSWGQGRCIQLVTKWSKSYKEGGESVRSLRLRPGYLSTIKIQRELLRSNCLFICCLSRPNYSVETWVVTVAAIPDWSSVWKVPAVTMGNKSQVLLKRIEVNFTFMNISWYSQDNVHCVSGDFAMPQRSWLKFGSDLEILWI